MAQAVCPQCGASFECTPEAACWCMPSAADAGSTGLRRSLVFVSRCLSKRQDEPAPVQTDSVKWTDVTRSVTPSDVRPDRLVVPLSAFYSRVPASPCRFSPVMSRASTATSPTFKIGRQHMYLLNRPDFIQDVLVTYHRNFMKSRMLQRAKVLLGEGLLTSEGESHLRQRRLVQPAFYRDRLVSYANTMASSARDSRGSMEARGDSRYGRGDDAQSRSRSSAAHYSARMSRRTLRISGKR